MNIAVHTQFETPCPKARKTDCKCGGTCRCGQSAFGSADMSDLRRYTQPAQIVAASADESLVAIAWSDGTTDRFHHGWLRENDPGPTSRHPHSRERIVPPLSIRDDVRPVAVGIAATGALSVTWAERDGGQTSLYDAGWLHAHSYSSRRQAAARPVQKADRPAPATARWDSLVRSQKSQRLWLDAYLAKGWSIVSGMPDEEGSAVALGELIGTIRSSNFGFSFDVKSKAEPISNAYTAGFLPLHTDLPHYEMPPGLQILHCLRNEAEGGESLLSDGIAVAELLRREQREVFDILTTVTVPYRFQDAESEYLARHTIIECDGNGDPVYINWSNSTMAPLDAHFDTMPALRAAIRRFVSLIDSPRFLIERKLTAGEALVFDNRRMLHGRAAFRPETGVRHLQGCYLDTSDVLSRYEVLKRRSEAAHSS
jgi:gamma-butyrobetaine dioxygenase